MARIVKPASGQSGPRIKLDVEALNDTETKVLGVLVGQGNLTLGDMASGAFPKLPAQRANSWVRNALRRLVCSELVRKVAPGVYSLTAKGSRQLGGGK